jgi:hypothetical protein
MFVGSLTKLTGPQVLFRIKFCSLQAEFWVKIKILFKFLFLVFPAHYQTLREKLG